MEFVGKLSREFSKGHCVWIKAPSRSVESTPTYEIGGVVVKRVSDVNYHIVRESGGGHWKLNQVDNLKAPSDQVNQGSSSKQSSSNEKFVANRESLQRTGSEAVRQDSPSSLGQELASGEGLSEKILTLGWLGQDLDNTSFELEASNEVLATVQGSNRNPCPVTRYGVPFSESCFEPNNSPKPKFFE